MVYTESSKPYISSSTVAQDSNTTSSKPVLFSIYIFENFFLDFFQSTTIFFHLRKPFIFSHHHLINFISTTHPYHQPSPNQTSYHHHHAPPIQQRPRPIHELRRRPRKRHRLDLRETAPPQTRFDRGPLGPDDLRLGPCRRLRWC